MVHWLIYCTYDHTYYLGNGEWTSYRCDAKVYETEDEGEEAIENCDPDHILGLRLDATLR